MWLIRNGTPAKHGLLENIRAVQGCIIKGCIIAAERCRSQELPEHAASCVKSIVLPNHVMHLLSLHSSASSMTFDLTRDLCVMR